MKTLILDILAWLLILTGLAMLVWKALGNSPEGILIISAIVGGLIIKTWNQGESLAGLRGKLNSDIPNIKQRLTNIESNTAEINQINQSIIEIKSKLKI